jgi:hypothetical protein
VIVLLIESDMARRHELAETLQARGLSVVTATDIAEVERWPVGDVVITEFRRFTPFWRRVGASHVVVLADTPGEGIDACDRGATAWLPRSCAVDLLVRLLDSIGACGAACTC